MKARTPLLLTVTLLALSLVAVAHAPALLANTGMELHLPLLSVTNPQGVITRVSVASDGAQANGMSIYPSVSGDGRSIAFMSEATNLVDGDPNANCDYQIGCMQVYVYERLTGKNEIVSVASDGAPGNRDSGPASISAGGRFVAFHSQATNLVPGDTNDYCPGGNGNCGDIFVHDRATGQTTRVSVASDGAEANGESFFPSISKDGRFVAFASEATNLVAGIPDVNCASYPGDFYSCHDIFVHDRLTGETRQVSVASDGTPANGHSGETAISASGRFVVFSSAADNLVDGDTNDICFDWTSETYTRNCDDIFVHDLATGETSRVSLATGGGQANGDSSYPAISADGRFVAFSSGADNLVAGDDNNLCHDWRTDMNTRNCSDIFVHDRPAGATLLVSVSSAGAASDGDSYTSSISGDGRLIAFSSWAGNLAQATASFSDDCHGTYLHDRLDGGTIVVACPSGSPSISGDGRFVAFSSSASNGVYGDTNDDYDIFLFDRRID